MAIVCSVSNVWETFGSLLLLAAGHLQYGTPDFAAAATACPETAYGLIAFVNVITVFCIIIIILDS